MNRSAKTLWIAVALFTSSAQAVPAFARQTGMACSQCHTVFPELTPFGRQFKAGGYTLTMTKQISEGGTDENRKSLEFPSYVPLGVMAIAGFTHTAVPQSSPDAPGVKNDDFLFPQEFSVFFAGKIAPMLGAFVQMTYDGAANHFGFDNADIRFAHQLPLAGKTLIIGATLNNSPTVSDLWNTTPVWGAPFSGSASAPVPGAATLLEGRLAQAVGGLGLYAFWDGLVYAEVDLYRSAPLGVVVPLSAATGATNVIDAVMPYWRLAVEKGFGSHSISVGTFGLAGVLLPGGSSTDPTTGEVIVHHLVRPGDRYTDIAFDAQYQYIGVKNIISAGVTYIYEAQTLEATNLFRDSAGGALGSDNLDNELHSFKLTAAYTFDRMVGARVVLSTMRGTSDATLYGGGGPRSTSLSGELFFMPWQNTRLGLQYTSYMDLNGDSEHAADANTLYAYAWLVF